MRTQVAIIGSGPAGLLLSHLLHHAGIESVILERRSRAYVEGRIRAGVLEQGTVAMLRRLGVAERLERIGLEHEGIEICRDGQRQRIDLKALTGGKVVTVYGQTEVTKDLIASRLASGGAILFEAEAVRPEGFLEDQSRVRFRHQGSDGCLDCDFIAGCDGFHGVTRSALPDGALRTFEKVLPFAWLGILAEAPPPREELIYASHPRGFALFSMRSPQRSRSYLQCAPDEDPQAWSDDRIWSELRRRLGSDGTELLQDGPVLEKSVTPMRSFLASPLRHGRLFLAGDAAHIVPPTGAKGLNLAASDVHYLAQALVAHYDKGEGEGLARYSDHALARVMKAQRFSLWMTTLLHRFPEDRGFDDLIQQAELDYLLSSTAAQGVLAENYVGLPY